MSIGLKSGLRGHQYLLSPLLREEINIHEGKFLELVAETSYWTCVLLR